MFHEVTLLGYVGRAPEMRYTPSGTAVTNFSVATSETWGSGDEKQTKTTWFKVTAWRQLAEICNQYVSKGDLVFIKGTLAADEGGNPKTFQLSNGNTGASYEVTIRTIKFFGKRGQQEYGEPTEPTEAQIQENDIPF